MKMCKKFFCSASATFNLRTIEIVVEYANWTKHCGTQSKTNLSNFVNAASNESSPASLVTEGREKALSTTRREKPQGGSPGSTSFPRVPIEVLVEQHQILPVRVRGVARVSSVARPLTALGRGDEERVDSSAELLADLQEVHLNP